MLVWTIPKRARIELDGDGWTVYSKRKSYRFNSLSECLCFLAGRGLIEYDQIDFLVKYTRRRFT